MVASFLEFRCGYLNQLGLNWFGMRFVVMSSQPQQENLIESAVFLNLSKSAIDMAAVMMAMNLVVCAVNSE